MRDQRTYLHIKVSAVQRYLLWHYAPDNQKFLRVTEFPKSGGTWLCQMLSDTLHLPFPRNQFMNMRRGIQHSHYPGPINDKKTILLVRDGRDIMVSAYYHFVIGHDTSPSYFNALWRRRLGVADPLDIHQHLATFIRLFFQSYKVGGRHLDWARYIESFDLHDPYLLMVRYEDLLVDAASELRKMLLWLGYDTSNLSKVASVVERYAFENQAGRQAGHEDVQRFLRKGIAGDWKNKFSTEAHAVFMELAGQQLAKLGYS